jgi:DNA-binding transcriptional ArsR family regulator
MEQQLIDDCEETCGGSEEDLQDIKIRMMSETTASEMADWFKALSDSTRIKLIGVLSNRELCVHDLTVLLEMNQSAVSHQLRYLRNLRLVKRRKAGKSVYYTLDDAHIEQIFHATSLHLQHK